MNGAADMTTAMVTMIAALAAVVGVILLAFFALRRFSAVSGAPGGQRHVSVLGSTYLGVKKSITLVAVPGAVLVLGITADRISLLRTIDDPDTVEGLSARPGVPAGISFLRHLQKATGKGRTSESAS